MKGAIQMIEIQELIHRRIILELTIRTFKRDSTKIDPLKMKNEFDEWFSVKIEELKQELLHVNSELGKKGITFQSEKADGDMTVYTVLVKGRAETRRYFNIALRNWVGEETKRLLGLPFRT